MLGRTLSHDLVPLRAHRLRSGARPALSGKLKERTWCLESGSYAGELATKGEGVGRVAGNLRRNSSSVTSPSGGATRVALPHTPASVVRSRPPPPPPLPPQGKVILVI